MRIILYKFEYYVNQKLPQPTACWTIPAPRTLWNWSVKLIDVS